MFMVYEILYTIDSIFRSKGKHIFNEAAKIRTVSKSLEYNEQGVNESLTTDQNSVRSDARSIANRTYEESSV